MGPHCCAALVSRSCEKLGRGSSCDAERNITRAGDGQVLGESLAAAWQSSPCLPGLASLLPAWREVAALLAPLVHHVHTQSSFPGWPAHFLMTEPGNYCSPLQPS